MDIEIEYTLYRETPDGEGEEITLIITGDFDSGEAPSRWGYYGACPGSPAEASESGIFMDVEVQGPRPNPHSLWLARNGSGIDTWELHLMQRHEANWPTSPEASRPVVYRMPWDGTLTPEEESDVQDALYAAGEEAVEAAREDYAERQAEARAEARADRYDD